MLLPYFDLSLERFKRRPLVANKRHHTCLQVLFYMFSPPFICMIHTSRQKNNFPPQARHFLYRCCRSKGRRRCTQQRRRGSRSPRRSTPHPPRRSPCCCAKAGGEIQCRKKRSGRVREAGRAKISPKKVSYLCIYLCTSRSARSAKKRYCIYISKYLPTKREFSQKKVRYPSAYPHETRGPCRRASHDKHTCSSGVVPRCI